MPNKRTAIYSAIYNLEYSQSTLAVVVFLLKVHIINIKLTAAMVFLIHQIIFYYMYWICILWSSKQQRFLISKTARKLRKMNGQRLSFLILDSGIISRSAKYQTFEPRKKVLPIILFTATLLFLCNFLNYLAVIYYFLTISLFQKHNLSFLDFRTTDNRHSYSEKDFNYIYDYY